MTTKSWLVSRRVFVEGAAAVAGAGASLLLPAFARAAGGPALRGEALSGRAGEWDGASSARSAAAAPVAPVITFYMDRPYLDLTGVSEPYIPPAGARSGQPLAAMTDEVFFSRFPY